MQRPSINYVVSKSVIFDPFPLFVLFYLIKMAVFDPPLPHPLPRRHSLCLIWQNLGRPPALWLRHQYDCMGPSSLEYLRTVVQLKPKTYSSMKKQTRQILTKKQSSFFSRSVFERHVMHKLKLVFFFQDPCVFMLAKLEQENDGTFFFLASFIRRSMIIALSS